MPLYCIAMQETFITPKGRLLVKFDSFQDGKWIVTRWQNPVLKDIFCHSVHKETGEEMFRTSRNYRNCNNLDDCIEEVSDMF